MSDKVQFREDPDLLRYLTSRGLSPNEVAKRAFEAEVRRMRAAEWGDRLRATRVRLGGEGSALVREDRDR